MSPAPDDTPDEDEATQPPMLRVVHGNPAPEELAALIAVVASRSGTTGPVPPSRSLWGRPGMRGSHRPAPGAWRASGLPSPVR